MESSFVEHGEARKFSDGLGASEACSRHACARQKSARAEYDAQFRSDMRSLLRAAVIARRPALAFSASGKSHIPSEANLVRRYSV